MKTYALIAAAAVVSFTTVAAEAGGFSNGKSKSLINVSPSVDVGNIAVGNGILNGSAILSGNNVSGILNGNTTGILNGVGVGILSGNKSYSLKK